MNKNISKLLNSVGRLLADSGRDSSKSYSLQQALGWMLKQASRVVALKHLPAIVETDS